MPGKRTLFNSNWKLDPQFKSWLTEDPGSVFSFTCMKCQVSRELGNLGKGALTQHMARQTPFYWSLPSKSVWWHLGQRQGPVIQQIHYQVTVKLLSRRSMQMKKICIIESKIVWTPQVKKLLVALKHKEPPSDHTWMTGEQVLKAEALWSMYTTVNHISNQASNNTSALFEVMFNVSKIAKQFTCAKDKNSYMAAFGLAPYFFWIALSITLWMSHLQHQFPWSI